MSKTWKHSQWGLQVLMDKIGAFEIWETMPHRNHYGGVMRKVGEQIEVDNVIYAVIEVTPTCALAKETGGKVVKFTNAKGEEETKRARGKGIIRVSTYRYK
tara:strand:+ start:174 stop:476 length:303 start_codon:yes stop_codon:yes gene_type:complete